MRKHQMKTKEIIQTASDVAIVGDIAGRYEELQQLIKLLGNIPLISVGDLNDRGPNSKAVLKLFMEKEHFFAVQSNHGHMMVDAFSGSNFYGKGIWLLNGGIQTLRSFVPNDQSKVISAIEHDLEMTYRMKRSPTNAELEGWWEELEPLMKAFVGPEYIQYLKQLPVYIETDKLIVTHAPIDPSIPFERVLEIGRPKNNVLWNLGAPRRRKDNKMQFHGHIANREVKFVKDRSGIFAVNTDTSAPPRKRDVSQKRKLSAVKFPSLEVVAVDYCSK